MHRFPGRIARGGMIAVAIVASGFALSGTSAHEGVPHPAHIHTGTCSAPGDVVFPLNDAGAATGSVVGSASALPVDTSETVVESALADIVSSDHAIVVHESSENIGTYILCGDIGGPMLSDSELVIGLGELNDSGASGVATLSDNGDGTTTVALYVTEMGDDAMEMDGDMPMASPDASPAMDGMEMTADEVMVEIKNFSFGDPIEIAVGTTVVFTNGDTVPHTVTDRAGSFQSDKIDPGATWRYTFTNTGTFTYFCEFHANMSGTVIVS